jgi:hypothetical protein
MAFIKKIFRRKKNVPLACSMTLENEEGHVHTGACFLDLQPLSVVEYITISPSFFKLANQMTLMSLSFQRHYSLTDSPTADSSNPKAAPLAHLPFRASKRQP